MVAQNPTILTVDNSAEYKAIIAKLEEEIKTLH